MYIAQPIFITNYTSAQLFHTVFKTKQYFQLPGILFDSCPPPFQLRSVLQLPLLPQLLFNLQSLFFLLKLTQFVI
jgi:hypothetical protein